MELLKCVSCVWETKKRCANSSCRVPVCMNCSMKWLCKTCRALGVKVNRLTLGKKRKYQTEVIFESEIGKNTVQNIEPDIKKSKPMLTKSIRERHDNIQEHVFKEQNETWVGEWTKCGQDFRTDQHARALFSCTSCEEDRKKRDSYNINQRKTRTYTVDNWTKPGDIWPWEFGLCENKECWGPYHRTLRIQRKGNFYRISTYKKLKSIQGSQEQIDQMFVLLQQKSGNFRHIYSGISKPIGICHIFWPLLKDEKEKKYHIYTEFISKKILPENVINLPRNKWPRCYYYDDDYNYPNRMEFRIFEETFTAASDMDTIIKLEDSGWPEIGRAYAFMYPGGAGCRLEFYKYKEGPHPRKRIETFYIPFYWSRGEEGYIENVQAGWTGPIISFWRRTKTDNPFFP